jgi:hypothetical protein
MAGIVPDSYDILNMTVSIGAMNGASSFKTPHNILYPLQHGFRKGLSCETQLIEFVDDITRNIDAGKQTDCLIMDFSKAFDKVSHSLLQHKLDHYLI